MTERAKYVINNLLAEKGLSMDRRCSRRFNYGEDVDNLRQEFRNSELKRNEELLDARKKMKIACAIAAMSWMILIMYFLG